MDDTSQQPQGSRLPARRLQLLADLAPGASVVLGLVTVWLVLATVQSLAQPMGSAAVISLVLNASAAVLGGLVTYRLGVGVPRTLRGWESALLERARVLRDE